MGCALRGVFNCSFTIMKFTLPWIPNRTIRLAERVQTVDPQYDIVDFGIESTDGNINSIAVGGSFAYAKRVCAPRNINDVMRDADAAEESAQMTADVIHGPRD